MTGPVPDLPERARLLLAYLLTGREWNAKGQHYALVQDWNHRWALTGTYNWPGQEPTTPWRCDEHFLRLCQELTPGDLARIQEVLAENKEN